MLVGLASGQCDEGYTEYATKMRRSHQSSTITKVKGAVIASAAASAEPDRWATKTKVRTENVTIDALGRDLNASPMRVTGLTSAWPTLT